MATPAAPASLSGDAQAMLQHLLDPQAEISVLIPTSIPEESLWAQFSLLCRSLNHLDKGVARAKLVLGHMLEMISRNPHLFKDKGYTTYEEFLGWVRENFGLARSTIFEARSLARDWGALPLDQYDAIGPSKLRILSKWTNANERGHEHYLKEASKRTVIGLQVWAEERNLIEKGETNGAMILIPTNQTVQRMWLDFINSPNVQRHCGEVDPGKILRCLLQECSLWAEEIAYVPDIREEVYVDQAQG